MEEARCVDFRQSQGNLLDYSFLFLRWYLLYYWCSKILVRCVESVNNLGEESSLVEQTLYRHFYKELFRCFQPKSDLFLHSLHHYLRQINHFLVKVNHIRAIHQVNLGE